MTDFDIPELTIRASFHRTLMYQMLWMILVGTVMLALPDSRFTSSSWQFIEMAPHGDDLVGAAYVLLGCVMAFCLRRDQRALSFAVGFAGMLNWTMGVFLLVGALNGSSGGLGFPLALYPGWHMISTAATLSKGRG